MPLARVVLDKDKGRVNNGSSLGHSVLARSLDWAAVGLSWLLPGRVNTCAMAALAVVNRLLSAVRGLSIFAESTLINLGHPRFRPFRIPYTAQLAVMKRESKRSVAVN